MTTKIKKAAMASLVMLAFQRILSSSTLFVNTSQFGNKAITNTLMFVGADVNGEDVFGDTALSVAAGRGDEETVLFLLKRGASIQGNSHANSPLHQAVGIGDIGTSKILIRNGADVNSRDINQQTPTHWAATRDNLEIIELLLSNGADINAIALEGLTPLHLAVFSNKPKTIQFLIEQGASKSIMTSEGETPLDIAKRKQHFAAIEALKAKLENKSSVDR